MISRLLSVNLTSIMRFLFSLLLGLVMTLPAYAATLYKWVDANGEVRYSDKLPAGQSKERFQTMSSTGRVLSTKEKSKSPEELRAERAEKKRMDQEVKAKAEKASKFAALQEHHDNVLLMTFTNENEILEAQDERLAVLDSVIGLLKKNVKAEQEKLLKEESIAKKLYRDKKLPVPGGQAQKIEYFTDKVISRQQHLSLKLEERDKIKQQYVQDLIRYRELTQLKRQ